MTTHRWGRLRHIGTLLVLLLSAGFAHSQTVEEFYKNKPITLLIGYEPGGTYDTYSRIVAPYLSKYLPGNPVIVPKNMPGASSLKAASYLYNQAPRDGTYIGMLGEGLPLHALLSPGDFHVEEFGWIGRITTTVDLAIAREGAPAKTIQDAMKTELITGAISAKSITGILPRVANRFLGTRYKIVNGYGSGPAILLALERKEIDVTHIYVDQLLLSRPGWLKNEGASVLLQYSEKRHPLLPNVPTLIEVAQGESKKILQLYASTAEVGRSYLAPPAVPPDQLAALRAAFDAAMKDPELRADILSRKLSLDPLPGEALGALIKSLLATPADIAAKAAEEWNE